MGSFKALQRNGHIQHHTPGFRRKTDYSGLRYYGDNGVWLDGNTLRLSLGLGRAEKVRQVTLKIAHRTDIAWRGMVTITIIVAVQKWRDMNVRKVTHGIDAQVIAVLSNLKPPPDWHTRILKTISEIFG